MEIKGNVIKVDKEITELDKFVLDIVEIIKRYTDYVIISGYVSIFFGRARATEDVDAFIREIPYKEFRKLYDDLKDAGYELNDEAASLYHDYLKNGDSINIWEKGFPLLRFELKFAGKKSQRIALENPCVAEFKGHMLKFPPIASQIAYKKFFLKSDKDLSDARHLEIVFGIKKDEIMHYKRLFTREK